MSAPARPGRLVVLAGARSSMVSTTIMALATTWARPALVAELDPAGGALAAAHHRSIHPGLVSLAASAAVEELSAQRVGDHTQSVNGVATLFAPVLAEQVETALVGQWGPLARQLGALGPTDALADCGRLSPGSAVLGEVLPEAHLVVLLCRPTADAVAHLHHRLATLASSLRDRVVVVLAGAGPYGRAEVAEALETEVVGTVADDPRGAGLLAVGGAQGRGFRRSLLGRSATALAETLGGR